MAWVLLKKMAGLEQRLPRRVRQALGMGRVISGLKGLWWIWVVVVSLITNGALWATLQMWPIESRVMVMAGVTMGVFLLFGHAGAFVKARSGELSLMTDRAFWDYTEELSEDMAGYLALVRITNVVQQDAARRALYRQITLHEPDPPPDDRLLEGIQAPRSMSRLVGEGFAVLKEAVRRGVITEEERKKYKSDKISGLHEGVNVILARLPQLTGLRGYRPTKRLASRTVAPPPPQDES